MHLATSNPYRNRSFAELFHNDVSNTRVFYHMQPFDILCHAFGPLWIMIFLSGFCFSIFGSQSEKAADVYDPLWLNDPEIKSGKHRTVINLPGFMGSIIAWVRESELRAEVYLWSCVYVMYKKLCFCHDLQKLHTLYYLFYPKLFLASVKSTISS